MRASNSDHLKALKTATFRLLNMIGISDFVPMTRVKTSVLSKYHAQHEVDYFIPVDVLLDAEMVAGSPILTEVLCRMHGGRFVKDAADVEKSPMKSVDAARMGLMDAFAVLNVTIKDAHEDGHIDSGEWQEIDRLAEQTIREIRAFQDRRRK